MSTGEAEKVNEISSFGKIGNQVFALLWAVVGVIVLVQSSNLPYMAEYGPGPGFVPFWMGWVFIVLGLALLMQVTFGRNENESVAPPSKHATLQMCLVMLGFFVFIFLADKAGFLLSLCLLFFFLLAVVERNGWKFSLVLSIINTGIFWVVFEFALELRLPIGFIEFLR